MQTVASDKQCSFYFLLTDAGFPQTATSRAAVIGWSHLLTWPIRDVDQSNITLCKTWRVTCHGGKFVTEGTSQSLGERTLRSWCKLSALERFVIFVVLSWSRPPSYRVFMMRKMRNHWNLPQCDVLFEVSLAMCSQDTVSFVCLDIFKVPAQERAGWRGFFVLRHTAMDPS